MKALSIKQPYAALILADIKQIENRSWQTNYRGALAIVSTKTPEPSQYWREARQHVKALGLAFPDNLATLDGFVLGIVTVTGMVGYDENDNPVTDHDHPQAVNLEWWTGSGYGWIMERPRKLAKPIPVKGALGLWNLPEDVERAVLAQLAKK